MKKMGQKSQIFMKIGVILSKFSLLKGMGEVWECQNCICDVLLSSKLVLDLNLDQFWGSKRNSSPAGNWTPVSRVTGGDTNHYTTEDLHSLCAKQRLHSDSGGQVKATSMCLLWGLTDRSNNWMKRWQCFVHPKLSPFCKFHYSWFLVPKLKWSFSARLVAVPMVSKFRFDQVILSWRTVVFLFL